MAERVCPCEFVDHPMVIGNPGGRDHLHYRVGDYDAFRAALLRALPGEVKLRSWRPTAGTDLGLQLVEWWAYLADILTFYSERIAHQAYIRTADDVGSVRRLTGLLGYRPRPGIGASGVLAALSNSPRPFSIPAGFQVQSKPGPGKLPQVFETDAEVVVTPTGAIEVEAPPATLLLDGASVLLRGRVAAVKRGDTLLLIPASGSSATAFAKVTVDRVEQRRIARGRPDTRVTFTTTPALAGALASDYRLVRSTQSAKLWPYAVTTSVITDSRLDLDAVRRDIRPGDRVLLEVPSGAPPPSLVTVTSSDEAIFYANGTNAGDPTVPPATGIPIGIPVTRLYTPGASAFNAVRYQVVVRAGWQDVGTLISWPPSTVPLGGGPAMITVVSGSPAFAVGTRPVLLDDATGEGVRAVGDVLASAPRSMTLTDLTAPSLSLLPPLRVLTNLLTVSRGQRVPSEILGGGDATVAGQRFTLKKSPLTYLASLSSDRPYRSTLRIWVQGSEWREVDDFYAQPPDARVFVTREDDEAHTTVHFGDGVNGARLPSGVGNVVASYRYGSGHEAPGVASLSLILRALPGLQSIRNPVPVAGGEDPDPPSRIRRLGPRSVLTFGRAVSGDDYEVIAAQTPGVAQARAYWTWDVAQQRTLVSLFVGDDAAAVTTTRLALAKSADPNRPVAVAQATKVRVRLSLTVRVEPDRQPAAVIDAVRSAIADPDLGLLGSAAVRIGGRLYESQVDDRCVEVPGVRAIRSVVFAADRGSGFVTEPGRWHDPGVGAYFTLESAQLILSPEVASDAT